MKTFIFGITAATILATTTPVTADNCDEDNLTGFDRIYCLRKIYFGHDARLNDNYKKLRALLPSDQRRVLRTAQRNWISKRNSLCMVDPDTVNVRCALNTTKDRADFLNDRIIECETVGCQASKLSTY